MIKVVFISFMVFMGYNLSAQVRPLYIGTYTSNGSKGVQVFDFDENTGKATFKETIEASNPSFLARKGDMLYMVNENTNGMASAFDLKNNLLLGSQPTQGAHPCHISLSPKAPLAVVSNYSGGSLILYSLGATGNLEQIQDFIQFSNSSIDKSRQSQSHIHSAFFGNDGQYLFVSDLGADLVYQYEIIGDVGNGFRFSLVNEIKTKAGGGPRHVVISDKGNRIYVVLELSGEIEVIENNSGNWESSQIVPIYHEGFQGEQGAADIKISEDGKYVYATNRGVANEIGVYKVLKNGQLKLIQIESVGGDSPRNVQLSPNGKWVLIANQKSGSVNIFERNKRNGKIKNTGEVLEVPSAVCTVF